MSLLSEIFKNSVGINLGGFGMNYNPFMSKGNLAQPTAPPVNSTPYDPTKNMSMAPTNMSTVPPPSIPPPVKKPIFSSTTQTPPATTQLDYSKYTNPATGQPYSPQEYANMMAKRSQGGGIPNYAGDALMNPNQTAEQLKGSAYDLNNARNDIATGTTDPYKVASQSGMQYTPAQLKAIESAYAGVYDPALKDVFLKIDAKEKEVAEEKAWAQELKKMAIQHEYSMEEKAASASASGNDYNLSAKQLQYLNGIMTKYQADTTVNQGLGATQIRNLTDAIDKDPANAGKQLIALYTLVKNLDPNSAVREGEVDLAQKTNSYLGQFGTTLARISEGKIISNDAVKTLNNATRLLAEEWVKAAQRRQKQYGSQAQVLGVSEPFNDYIGGFNNPDMIDTGIIGGGGTMTSPDGTQEVSLSDLTPAQIKEAQDAGWK